MGMGALPFNMNKNRPSDMICVKVGNAMNLPEAPLGDTNPFVILDWGELGQAQTQTIYRTVDPEFNCSLRFRSPLTSKSNYDKLSIFGAENSSIYSEKGVLDLLKIVDKIPNLSISVYSKNMSISDELLCHAEIDPRTLFQKTLNLNFDSSADYRFGQIPLFSYSSNEPSGFIEISTCAIR
jgi:hypothetical protein